MKKALAFALIFLVLVIACSRTERIDLATLEKAGADDLTTVYAPGDTTFRDRRLRTIRKGRDMAYEMPRYESLQAWQKRAEELRRHILISTGLWPMPEKTPLKARIYDRIERDDYTVEKVYFESYPGFFVTGNLYRPKGKSGPFPGIISPHGHWQNGRLENSERGSVPGRCINFAKQGYVIFSYDMVGYQDSRQISHRFAADSLHQLWGINLMGLQLWNSIRAIDFLTSLEDVDAERIGCTGASGGGTQTFMVTAVDDRIKVAAPGNMISAHFQGGCLCENAPGLRLNTFNVEIAALAAPRPLLMVSATGDWTKNTLQVEYPMVRTIYKLYGAEDRLKAVQFDYPHNYNKDSREAVYAWFARWFLNDDEGEKYREVPFQVEPDEKLLNFSDSNPPPGDMDEEKLTAFLKKQTIESLQRLWPTDGRTYQKFEKIYGEALKHVLEVEWPEDVTVKTVACRAGDGFAVSRLLLSRTGQEDWIPAIFYQPSTGKNEATLLVNSLGKAALAPEGAPDERILKRLAQGQCVLVIDVFRIGEHILPAGMKGRSEDIPHFTTFNKTDLQERVQDIVTAAAFLHEKYRVNLMGLGEGGWWVLLASTQIPTIESLLADLNALDPSAEALQVERLFAPGLLRIGGLPTAAVLSRAKKMILYNVSKAFPIEKIRRARQWRKGGKEIEFHSGDYSI